MNVAEVQAGIVIRRCTGKFTLTDRAGISPVLMLLNKLVPN